MVPPNGGLVWAHIDHECPVRRLKVLRDLGHLPQTMQVRGGFGDADSKANHRSVTPRKSQAKPEENPEPTLECPGSGLGPLTAQVTAGAQPSRSTLKSCPGQACFPKAGNRTRMARLAEGRPHSLSVPMPVQYA